MSQIVNVKLQAQSRYNSAEQFYFAKKGQVTKEVYSTMHHSQRIVMICSLRISAFMTSKQFRSLHSDRCISVNFYLIFEVKVLKISECHIFY